MVKRAIEKLIRGALKYRTDGLNNEFKSKMARLGEESLPKNPANVAILITCMDSRLHPSFFTQTGWSNATFKLRNPGNMVPNAEIRQKTEANLDKSDFVVCGHSDCKAMSGLHSLLEDKPFDSSPLLACIHHYGSPTLRKWAAYNKNRGEPVKFCQDLPGVAFEAIIDPQEQWNDTDELSQINTLQQLENIASHPNLRGVLTAPEPERRVHLHAMWYEIESADVWMFDKAKKIFRLLDEDLANAILSQT